MNVTVHIPGALREYSGGSTEIVVSASTVRSALEELAKHHRLVYISVCDETGAVRQHVNMFVNSELVRVREPDGIERKLNPGDELTIWPAVSGG